MVPIAKTARSAESDSVAGKLQAAATDAPEIILFIWLCLQSAVW